MTKRNTTKLAARRRANQAATSAALHASLVWHRPANYAKKRILGRIRAAAAGLFHESQSLQRLRRRVDQGYGWDRPTLAIRCRIRQRRRGAAYARGDFAAGGALMF